MEIIFIGHTHIRAAKREDGWYVVAKLDGTIPVRLDGPFETKETAVEAARDWRSAQR